MKAEKWAAGDAATRSNNQRKTSYQSTIAPSSLKNHVGEFLLSVSMGRREEQDWRRFERLLRDYYGEENP